MPEIVTSSMPSFIAGDLHICGCCRKQFSKIEEFLLHKENNCVDLTDTILTVEPNKITKSISVVTTKSESFCIFNHENIAPSSVANFFFANSSNQNDTDSQTDVIPLISTSSRTAGFQSKTLDLPESQVIQQIGKAFTRVSYSSHGSPYFSSLRSSSTCCTSHNCMQERSSIKCPDVFSNSTVSAASTISLLSTFNQSDEISNGIMPSPPKTLCIPDLMESPEIYQPYQSLSFISHSASTGCQGKLSKLVDVDVLGNKGAVPAVTKEQLPMFLSNEDTFPSTQISVSVQSDAIQQNVSSLHSFSMVLGNGLTGYTEDPESASAPIIPAENDRNFENDIEILKNNCITPSDIAMRSTVSNLSSCNVLQDVSSITSSEKHSVNSVISRSVSHFTPNVLMPEDSNASIIIKNPIPDHLKNSSPLCSLSSSVNNACVSSTAHSTGTKNCFKENDISIVRHPSSLSNKFNSPNGTKKYKIIKVDGVKRFKCESDCCRYTTPHLKDFSRHFRTHSGEKPFSCSQCSKTFSRVDKLKLHERWHSGIKPYKCDMCSYESRDFSSLKKHQRIHSNERPFKCQICPYAGRNMSQLTVHLRTHTGDTPFHCSECPSKFKINSDLKRHMRMHTGEKPFKCELCPYSCSVKANLLSHVRVNHSVDQEWKCSKCDFTSPSRKKVRDHERIHRDTPYHCSSCSYTTSSKQNLKSHTLIHTNEKPYKCELCSYSSRQSCNLKTHLKKHHDNESSNSIHSDVDGANEETSAHKSRRISNRKLKSSNKTMEVPCSKTFKCKLCADSFVREDSFRSHLRHHGIQMKSSTISVIQLHEQLTVQSDKNCYNLFQRDECSSQESCNSSETLGVASNGNFGSTNNIQTVHPVANSRICSTSDISSKILSLNKPVFSNAHNSSKTLDIQIGNTNSKEKECSNENLRSGILNEGSSPSLLIQSAKVQDHSVNYEQHRSNIQESSLIRSPLNNDAEEMSSSSQVSLLKKKTDMLLAEIQNGIISNAENVTNTSGNSTSNIPCIRKEEDLTSPLESISNCMLPPDLVTVPKSSLLPINSPTCSSRLSTPHISNGSYVISPDQNEVCVQKDFSNNVSRLIYQIPSGVSIITLPVVPINYENEELPAENQDSISKSLSLSHAGVADSDDPLNSPTVLCESQNATVLQLPNISPAFQYLIQPTTTKTNSTVSGIGQMTVLLRDENSDPSLSLWSDLSSQILTESDITSALLSHENTLQEAPVSHIPNISCDSSVLTSKPSNLKSIDSIY